MCPAERWKDVLVTIKKKRVRGLPKFTKWALHFVGYPRGRRQLRLLPVCRKQPDSMIRNYNNGKFKQKFLQNFSKKPGVAGQVP